MARPATQCPEALVRTVTEKASRFTPEEAEEQEAIQARLCYLGQQLSRLERGVVSLPTGDCQ